MGLNVRDTKDVIKIFKGRYINNAMINQVR